MLFVDFETGSILRLTGRARIDWDSKAVVRIPGARRLVTIDIEAVVELSAALPLLWDGIADSVRSLRVVEKIHESNDVASFVFAARDDGPLSIFKAGQYLPIELDIPGFDKSVSRTYSLSSAPGTERYRISVKRESHGPASRHLHDNVQVGAILDARIPSGDFVLPCVAVVPSSSLALALALASV